MATSTGSDVVIDVVIAHGSDIHVGCDEATRANGGDETLVLKRVLDAAKGVGAHAVVLAGDVFEHNRLAEALVERAAALIGGAGRPVVVLPGNHDPLITASVWRRDCMAELPNLHVLGVTNEGAVCDGSVSFPDLDLEIWGRPHRSYADMAPLAGPYERTTRWQIAMAHGHYQPKPTRAEPPQPAWLICDDDITATAADYVALGHWNRAVKVGNGQIPAHYSGSPTLTGTINIIRLTAGGQVLVGTEPVSR